MTKVQAHSVLHTGPKISGERKELKKRGRVTRRGRFLLLKEAWHTADLQEGTQGGSEARGSIHNTVNVLRAGPKMGDVALGKNRKID